MVQARRTAQYGAEGRECKVLEFEFRACGYEGLKPEWWLPWFLCLHMYMGGLLIFSLRY